MWIASCSGSVRGWRRNRLAALGDCPGGTTAVLSSPWPRKNPAGLIEARRQSSADGSAEYDLVIVRGGGPRQVFKTAGIGTVLARVHMAGHVRSDLLPALRSNEEGVRGAGSLWPQAC